jgi:hypothetical protein
MEIPDIYRTTSLNGAKEACQFVKNVDFELSEVAFDATFEK